MKLSLRVLVISLEYPPCSIGGYEVMCAQVCQWLEQRGHDVQVSDLDRQMERIQTSIGVASKQLATCYGQTSGDAVEGLRHPKGCTARSIRCLQASGSVNKINDAIGHRWGCL